VLPKGDSPLFGSRKEVKQVNFDQVMSFLSENPLHFDFFDSDNVNTGYSRFRDHINHALNIASTSKLVRQTNNCEEMCAPWIDRDLKKLCKRKQVLLGKVKARPENEFLKQEYKTCCNSYFYEE